MHAPGEQAVRATYQQAARSITPFPRPRLGGFIEEQETVSFAPQPKATACPLPSVHIPYSSALSRASPASWGVSHRARRREAAAAHPAERALAQQHARAVRVHVELHILRAQPPCLGRHLGQLLRQLRPRPTGRRRRPVPTGASSPRWPPLHLHPSARVRARALPSQARRTLYAGRQP